MNKHKEFNDFKSCIEAVGSYWNLHSMLCFLANNEYDVQFDEDTLDEAYDSIQRDEFYDATDIFDIEEFDTVDNEAIDEFLRSTDFTDADFKQKCAKFIVKEILPNHSEW